MALDTRDKRSSSVDVLLPWRDSLPLADGVVGQSDKAELALLYTGITASPPSSPSTYKSGRRSVFARLGQREPGLIGPFSGIPSPEGFLSLEPPMSSELISEAKSIMAFGFDRLTAGYAGNTVQLKRLSDNATQDFGFDGIGIFTVTAFDTWRAGADVDVVKFYNQCGGAKTLDAVGVVAFVRSNIIKRFATNISSTDMQLTRSTTEGGVGADLGDDVGCFQLGTSGVLASAGVEFHLLFSNNERKSTSTLSGDAFGSNSIQEYIFAYGNTLNTCIHHFGPTGSTKNFIRARTSGGETDDVSSDGVSSSLFYKQFAQNVFSYTIDPSSVKMYGYGRLNLNKAWQTTNSTNITNGVLDNGKIVVGNTFVNTTDTTLRTSLRANCIFGGLVVTKSLTDLQRFTVQSKLSAVGQQHRIKLPSEISAYFDEVVLMKNVNQITGVLSGETAALTLNFNTSADFNFNYSIPNVGLKGIYAADDTNPNNGFKATSNFFAGTTSGTVLSLSYLDLTGIGASYGNNVSQTFNQATGDQYGGESTDWSLGIGFDHGQPALYTLIAGSKETTDLIGRRHKADETVWSYDMGNQLLGKYNRAVGHVPMIYNESFGGDTLTQSFWEGSGSPYLLDAPVFERVKDHLQPPFSKRDFLCMQIATFQAPIQYNRSDPFSVRKLYRLNAINKSYMCAGTYPIGHQDGTIAINENAAVCDSDDNAVIMSMSDFQQAFKGTRVAFAFSSQVLTETQIEEVAVNFYKLVV